MTVGRVSVAGYWGPRPEAPDACAARLAGFLERIARSDPGLTTWWRKGRGVKDARRRQIDTSVESLTGLLGRGVNRTDVGRQVIPALGFSLDGWNGDSERPASLSVGCGMSSPRLKNVCLVDLPPIAADLVESVAREVLIALVEEWDPDHALVITDASRAARAGEETGLAIGWLTYLAARRGNLPVLSTRASVERLPSGDLITLGALESASEDKIRDLRGLLAAQGFLRPPTSSRP